MKMNLDDFVNEIEVRNPLLNKGLKDKLAISENRLDDEMRAQPSLAFIVGAALGQAQKQYERLKRSADLVRASLSKEVRLQAQQDGEKITEPAIVSEVDMHPLMNRIEELVIDAREVLSICKSMNEAFDQRSRMISQLAKRQADELALTSFYARAGSGSNTESSDGRDPRMKRALGKNQK